MAEDAIITRQCMALTWDKTASDYVPCSDDQKLSLCRLEGIMLAVEVVLCNRHENYFRSKPPGWRSVELEVLKTYKVPA